MRGKPLDSRVISIAFSLMMTLQSFWNNYFDRQVLPLICIPPLIYIPRIGKTKGLAISFWLHIPGIFNELKEIVTYGMFCHTLRWFHLIFILLPYSLSPWAHDIEYCGRHDTELNSVEWAKLILNGMLLTPREIYAQVTAYILL